MTRTIGIGIFVALVLSLAAVACGGGPSSGATGAGGHVLLEIDELGAESDLVVLGELNSSEKITKTVQDTSQPADLRGDDYIIQVKQVSFTVSEYLKGSGDDTITITPCRRRTTISTRTERTPSWPKIPSTSCSCSTPASGSATRKTSGETPTWRRERREYGR